MAKPKIVIPAIGPDEVLIQVISEADESGRAMMIVWWWDGELRYLLPMDLKNEFGADDPRNFTHGQVCFGTLQRQLDYWEGRTTYRGYRGQDVPFIDPGALKVRVEPFKEDGE